MKSLKLIAVFAAVLFCLSFLFSGPQSEENQKVKKEALQMEELSEALEVLKLKDVVDALEAAIDAFEKVANTIEQIAVKES